MGVGLPPPPTTPGELALSDYDRTKPRKSRRYLPVNRQTALGPAPQNRPDTAVGEPPSPPRRWPLRFSRTERLSAVISRREFDKGAPATITTGAIHRPMDDVLKIEGGLRERMRAEDAASDRSS